ncbi:hypothetical protein CBS101457_005506 [Exobasidium rhododendri]|nr:hypothetical protein CBS101457_005506 [Exobasidium rhododendri]
MNLLKLGGVGGVTRSGSWGRNQTNFRDTFAKPLPETPMEDEKDEMAQLATDRGSPSSLTKQMMVGRARSIDTPLPPSKVDTQHFRTCSSDEPSSSSRTSISSYSAAAFSLRSLSNRNSVSSTTSSNASCSRSSPTAASEDESTATNTSNRVSQILSDTISDSILVESPIQPHLDDTMAEDDASWADRNVVERIGPGVSRIRSIGRAGEGSIQLDVEDAQEAITYASSETLSKEQSQRLDLSQSLDIPVIATLSQSQSTSSSPNSLSQQMNSLTLSAAAKSPMMEASDSASTSTFVPPTPRRHTGAFALRSLSALSQSGGAYGTFSGGGGGRAAARESAKNTTLSYENAPFSELEARRAIAQSSPTRRPAFTSTASQPSTPILFRGFASSQMRALNMSSSDSIIAGDRRVPGEQKNLTPIFLSSATADGHSTVKKSTSPVGSSFRDENGKESSVSPLLIDGDRRGKVPRSPPSPFSMEDASVPQSAFVTTSNASVSGPGTSKEQADDNAKGIRPILTHSASGTLTSTNVLRTPTTEEWSRFLAKQGLDPAVVASNTSIRLRTSTGRSVASQRRQLSDRVLTSLTLAPATTLDAAAAAALSASASASASASTFVRPEKETVVERNANPVGVEVDSDGSEDSDEEALMDSLRKMGLTQGEHNKASSFLLEADEYNKAQKKYRREGDDEEEQGSDGGEGGEDSSSDERMQALHEAISRPPSRRGSPTLSNLSFLGFQEADTETQGDTVKRSFQRPSRDLAAAVEGYPLPPLGERRKIDDFVIVSDIGRGAYGLVKRVRLKDQVTGVGVGKEFCIKYIIKSRILADCWRRHKILGPIPIEIHVLDQLRRLPYKSPVELPPWSVEQLLHLDMMSSDGSVGHPSLCKMLDFFEDREFYYMVMPCFGQGQDLFDHVESQPHGLSSLQVRCIFGQIADGLRFLHQNNIVHRDVKDENVILDGKGHVQIIDFGSAAHVNKNGRLFDTFSGTLDYAAAEILKGEKYGGKEQDVWALGVVGYVLLCGDCPFWNGEEAIQGLHVDTRAHHVLRERCQPLKNDSGNSPSLCVEGEDLDEEEEKSRPSEEMAKRTSDLLGQLDGGGKIKDAVNLIECCLEIEASMRPSMDMICQHRFLVGDSGWYGHLGWRNWSTRQEL